MATITADGFAPGLPDRVMKKAQWRLIPLIFLTAFDKEESFLRLGYAAGAVDYVVKPFQPEILRAKVQ